jgi:predicted DNA-binding transcriptional regulator YafY
MNRRGFLRAVSATGLLLMTQSPAVGAAGGSKESMERQLRQALVERRVVQFKYHGHTRVVEPHALGHVSEERLALLGWQVSGGSASEPPPGWRTFVLAEIQSLRRLRKTYTPRADYRPQTTQLKSIEAEVATGAGTK